MGRSSVFLQEKARSGKHENGAYHCETICKMPWGLIADEAVRAAVQQPRGDSQRSQQIQDEKRPR